MDRKYSTITALHWINRAKSVCERLNVSSISCNAHKCPFGCGISKMVGPKKQDFCPKIYILKGNHCIL